jgi:hypothetical protein
MRPSNPAGTRPTSVAAVPAGAHPASTRLACHSYATWFLFARSLPVRDSCSFPQPSQSLLARGKVRPTRRARGTGGPPIGHPSGGFPEPSSLFLESISGLPTFKAKSHSIRLDIGSFRFLPVTEGQLVPDSLVPASLEACRLLMLAIGLVAIPVALLIEWLRPQPWSRSRTQTPDQKVVVTPTKSNSLVVKVTPRIKGIH